VLAGYATIGWSHDQPEVVQMCHERWLRRRDRRREERFDRELRYLLDEEPARPEPARVVEHDREEEPRDPERVRVEAATRA
jgi:hypothetical protein